MTNLELTGSKSIWAAMNPEILVMSMMCVQVKSDAFGKRCTYCASTAQLLCARAIDLTPTVLGRFTAHVCIGCTLQVQETCSSGKHQTYVV